MKVIMREHLSGSTFDMPIGSEQEFKKGTAEMLISRGQAAPVGSTDAEQAIAKRRQDEADLVGNMVATPCIETR